MKLAPGRNKFIEVIGGTGDINAVIEKFCTLFYPILEEDHKFRINSQLVLESEYEKRDEKQPNTKE